MRGERLEREECVRQIRKRGEKKGRQREGGEREGRKEERERGGEGDKGDSVRAKCCSVAEKVKEVCLCLLNFFESLFRQVGALMGNS